MEHAREIDLIELTAGRLEAEQERTVRAHVQDCPACRTRLHDIQKTWDLLGAWKVQPAEHAERTGREAAFEAPEGRRHPLVVRFPGIRMVTRVAAALVVSVLIGYAGGRWSVRPAPTGPVTEPPQYFSVLGSEVGGSFSSLVLQDGPSSSQES